MSAIGTKQPKPEQSLMSNVGVKAETAISIPAAPTKHHQTLGKAPVFDHPFAMPED